jgi:acyl CoA:acetate/3-ketoacid CoA transferase alpha subunit
VARLVRNEQNGPEVTPFNTRLWPRGTSAVSQCVHSRGIGESIKLARRVAMETASYLTKENKEKKKQKKEKERKGEGKRKKSIEFSPQATYTDRAAAAGLRSYCQLL